jgi:hypothetical protein
MRLIKIPVSFISNDARNEPNRKEHRDRTAYICNILDGMWG